MIKTRSKYFIDIPLSSAEGDVEILIYIWNGSISDKPENETYKLTQSNPTLSTEIVEINVSNLIDDYLDYNPVTETNTTVVNSSNEVFISIDRVFNDVTTNIVNDIAIKGYASALDGKNADVPSTKILLNGDYFKVNKSGNFLIPFIVGGSDITVKSYPNNEIDFTFTNDTNINSNTYLKYAVINAKDAVLDDIIEVTYNDNTITLELFEEYRYSPLDVHFINKSGAQQIIPFFKERIDSFDIESEQYKSNVNDISNGDHKYIDYNKNSRSSFSVNSGYIEEEHNEIFKQLLLSERVWISENNTLIPVNIETKTLEYKTQQNDKLIKYTLDFKYSFDEIL